MRKVHILGIAFAAIFAFSMVAASGASAFSLWDECTKEASLLEFSNSDCTEKVAPLTFGWLEITAALEVDSLVTTLTLSSNGVVIDCEGSQVGTVGGGVNGEVLKLLNKAGEEVTSAKPVTCTVLAGLCGASATAFPVHLPWKTELVAEGNLLTTGGAGNPGWSVTCANGLKNECTKADAVLSVANLEAELEVDFTFNSAEKATCTVGEGKVEGTVSVLLTGTERALRAM